MTKQYVLILGNGFSLDMLEKANLQSHISLTKLIPPSDDVKYLPFAMDKFTERPLWDQRMWPLIVLTCSRNLAATNGLSLHIWRLTSPQGTC